MEGLNNNELAFETITLASSLSENSQDKDNKKNGILKNHRDVLNGLLEEIIPINVREFLELPENVDTRQKHIIVATNKNLLEVASRNKWNLAKVYDYV